MEHGGHGGEEKMDSRLLLFMVCSESGLAFTHHFTLPLGPHSILLSPVSIGCHRVGVGRTFSFGFSPFCIERR